MMNYDYYYKKVEDKLKANGKKGEERFIHSLGVSDACVELVNKYHPNDEELKEKAKLAGLVHDYAKFLTMDDYRSLLKKHNIKMELNDEFILIYHGYIGYLLIEDELDIHDQEILNAIIYHSTGRSEMSFLEKVLFVADYIEPNRVGEFFDKIRDVAFVDLDLAVYYEAKQTYEYLASRNRNIFFETLNAYQYYKKLLNK